MSYKLEWNPSPNFTPGSQTQRFYGQPRSIKFGAGHWWNLPTAGARHDGIVSVFKNPARQGSTHAVLSAGRVTQMVRKTDTAWTTNNANPYTYSIEVDPRIMWKWTAKDAAKKKLGEQIFDTLAEYIADMGMHNLVWHPHKKWWSTECNPIYWGAVMNAAKAVHAAKNKPAPTVKIVSRQAFSPLKEKVFKSDTTLRNMPSNSVAASKVYKKGETIKFAEVIRYSDGKSFYRTSYSKTKNIFKGFGVSLFADPVPPLAEWEKNLKDITDVKLKVLAANAPIYDLNTGKEVGKPIPQGTWIDIAKQTTIKGKVYLISAYSVKNAMTNGILKDHLGIPAPTPEKPKPEPTPEPEWLKNWEDIEDVEMFARDDIEAVNMLDGSKAGETIDKGTPIQIASSTEWMGQKYLITTYSTKMKFPVGIRLLDLSMSPVVDTAEPIPEDPEQPVDEVLEGVKQNTTLLKEILKLLTDLVKSFTGIFKTK